MQSKPLEDLPGGFYTTMDEKSRFMGGNLGYEMYIPSDAKILDLASTGRVTDRIPIKELQQYQKEGYDLIKGRNMLRQDEYIPLNKEKITGWNQFTQNRKELSSFQQGGNFSKNEIDFLSEIAIKDNNGYWNKNNHGKVVEISSPDITMKNVNQDLIGISKETGEKKLMKKGNDYFFKNTKNVLEIPLFKYEEE